MGKITNKISRKTGLLTLILVCALVLRIVNLGYSDYQGDETKAFYNPKDQTFSQFLLSQRRAPIQFVITLLIKGVSNNYHNEFITRLPFALFSIISCYMFFVFVKKLINEDVAFYSLIFFVTNGLFVAFGRIVQYQSLVILLDIMVLYQLLLLVETNKIKHLYLAGIIWGFNFLVHTDALYIFPMTLLLIIEWAKKHEMNAKITLKKMLPALVLGLAVLMIFYGPYLLNLPKDALNYWKARVDGTQQANVVSNSKYTFSVYQPIYVIHLYILAGILGTVLTIFNKSLNKERKIGIISWFIFSYIFMEYIVKDPGTHIYNYVMPLTILMGIFFYSFNEILKIKIKKLVPIFIASVFILFIFLFLQSYAIFVDHSKEYPWQDEKFLIWTFPILNPVFKPSLFGFPYNRNWEGVQSYILNDGRSTYYTTNERKPIPRYYLHVLEHNSSKAGYYIRVIDPQSGTNDILNDRSARWVKDNKPEKSFYVNNNLVSEVYFIPENWK